MGLTERAGKAMMTSAAKEPCAADRDNAARRATVAWASVSTRCSSPPTVRAAPCHAQPVGPLGPSHETVANAPRRHRPAPPSQPSEAPEPPRPFRA